MAATVTLIKRTVMGDMRVSIADVTFDSSYPTGGEALDLGQLGLGSAEFVNVSSAGGYVVQYDYASNKLLAYVVAGTEEGEPLTEVAATTDLDELTVRVMAFGQ